MLTKGAGSSEEVESLWSVSLEGWLIGRDWVCVWPTNLFYVHCDEEWLDEKNKKFLFSLPMGFLGRFKIYFKLQKYEKLLKMIKRGILIPLWWKMFFVIRLYSLFIVTSYTNGFPPKYTQYSTYFEHILPWPISDTIKKKQGKCFKSYILARMFTKGPW